MGKVGKILAGVVLLVVIAVAAVTTLVLSNLDDIIKQVVESAGSQAVGTSVTLDAAQVSLKDGRGELRGLTIANPPGYDTDYAFQMSQIALELDPGSIAGDVVVIREILIDGAVLLAEQKMASTNLTDLVKNMSSGQSASEPAADSSGTGDIKLAVEKFSFINNKATLVTQQWGDQSLDIPDIRMNNLGTAEAGLTPQQLANQITGRLIKQVEKSVSNSLEKLAKDAAKKELEKQLEKNLSEDDKKKVDALKSMFKKN